jgi:CubicO group peptidase (beta-lactamase class C family)
VQALGFVLEAAVGKSISAYLAEKLWKPLGMESERSGRWTARAEARRRSAASAPGARDFAASAGSFSTAAA